MKMYVVTNNETVKGVYSSFENALKMAKAWKGVHDLDCRISPTECDHIDWESIYNHVKIKVQNGEW